MDSVHHRAELAGVDEKRFTPPVPESSVLLVTREEPQAHRDLGGVEELTRQRDHAVDEIRVDDVLADLLFARLVGGYGAVGEHEAGKPGGGQVVEEMMHPGVVGIPRGWGAVDPGAHPASPPRPVAGSASDTRQPVIIS